MKNYVVFALSICLFPAAISAQSLPGTKPLEIKGDLARLMVDGIDRYLTRATDAAIGNRQKSWERELGSTEPRGQLFERKRERLRKLIGAVDPRLPVKELEYVGGSNRQEPAVRTPLFSVFSVRWPVLPGVYGEGLLLEPSGKPKALVVAVPDADQLPETLVGLTTGLPAERPFARLLAEQGCRVVIPTLVNRQDTWSGSARLKRFTNQTHREFIYRMSYEMGRHVIGYEVQKILAAADWFTAEKNHAPVGVYGFGEGGLLALVSAALDTRIDATVVSGYFGPREDLYKEPIYRNIWGQLLEFDDFALAQLIKPRTLIVDSAAFTTGAPPAARPGRSGAAPGFIAREPSEKTLANIESRANAWPELRDYPKLSFKAERGPRVTFLENLHVQLENGGKNKQAPPLELREPFEPEQRQRRQVEQLVDFTQKLQPAAVQRRQEFFWSKLDTSSVAKFRKSQEPLRDYFLKEIIGNLPEPTLPGNPRTRLVYETPKWKGYEVVLDVYEDVFSYGILLVPNDIKPGERRPCVVCQHGLEGRPTKVVDPKQTTQYYNSYGAKLADMGFVVFAPQNPYIFGNDFRQLLRKAHPLKLSLYAFILRQHQRILEWLQSQSFIDPSRIAFYGLSYGGKVAMRIPALLDGYCLSICSGDFNEWIWKNINLDWLGSYMFSNEYDMYEFDLANTFNYAEMAVLIAPRPFMVERGHADGVGLDEYVAFEYAKVRRLYAKLDLADRTAIEFFSGGHEIHLQGTLAFLRKHLRYPR